jgi:hypothetical protein
MRDTVAIGWLDAGQVDGQFALSIAHVYAQRNGRVSDLLRLRTGGLLSHGRNKLVARFMSNTDAQWLLMIDSDEELSLAAFDKLCDAAHDAERPIVSGLVFAAFAGNFYPMPVPCIYKDGEADDPSLFAAFTDYPADTVVPVDSAGAGCLLVHRDVFAAFRAGATEHQGADWCWFHDGPVNGHWLSEDHWFCQRARELGFPLHAHTGATLPHHKDFWISERHYEALRAAAATPPALERR